MVYESPSKGSNVAPQPPGPDPVGKPLPTYSQARSTQPQTPTITPALGEKKLGFFKTIKEVLFTPSGFFSRDDFEQNYGGIGNPLVFLLKSTLIIVAISTVTQLARMIIVADASGLLADIFRIFFIIIAGFGGGILGEFLDSGIIHLAVKIVGGKERFSKTFPAVVYPSVSLGFFIGLAFSAIQVGELLILSGTLRGGTTLGEMSLGMVLAVAGLGLLHGLIRLAAFASGIWVIVVQVIGLKIRQHISTGRAVVAALSVMILGVVLLIGLMVLMGVLFYAGFFRQATASACQFDAGTTYIGSQASGGNLEIVLGNSLFSVDKSLITLDGSTPDSILQEDCSSAIHGDTINTSTKYCIIGSGYGSTPGDILSIDIRIPYTDSGGLNHTLAGACSIVVE